MCFDKRKRGAGLIGENIDGHVKSGLVGQKDLQASVLISEERLAFDLALIAHDCGWFGNTRKRLILLLKEQDAGGRATAANLNIFADILRATVYASISFPPLARSVAEAIRGGTSKRLGHSFIVSQIGSVPLPKDVHWPLLAP